jgi:hypothetical protein
LRGKLLSRLIRTEGKFEDEFFLGSGSEEETINIHIERGTNI